MYRVKGARGVEVIPNYTFWKEIPFLIKVPSIAHIGGMSIHVHVHVHLYDHPYYECAHIAQVVHVGSMYMYSMCVWSIRSQCLLWAVGLLQLVSIVPAWSAK